MKANVVEEVKGSIFLMVHTNFQNTTVQWFLE